MALSLDSGKSYKSPLGSSSTNLRREGRGILFKINLRDFPGSPVAKTDKKDRRHKLAVSGVTGDTTVVPTSIKRMIKDFYE